MCELKAILIDSGVESFLMEDVVRITISGDNIELTGLLGEKKLVQGKLSDVNLTKHEVIIVK
jgi:hypothetical protein